MTYLTTNANLRSASLATETDDSGWLVFAFEVQPEGSFTKCNISELKGIDRRTVERRLTARGMPVTIESGRPHFRAGTPELLKAVDLVVDTFDDLYDFGSPEFWYYTPHNPQMEFCVRGYEQGCRGYLELTCCTWRNKTENTETLRGFEEVLRGSELCEEGSVRHRGRTFQLSLTEAAIKHPLESFRTLVNLHLEYLAEVPTAPPGP